MNRYIKSMCDNCGNIYPGKYIKVDKELNCIFCGESISNNPKVSNKNWDTYFHKVCTAVASKSPCLSRQIGAILVRDKSIVSTGFNGPARRFPHCIDTRIQDIRCPRHAQGFKSGEGLIHCPAAHAEGNCIANAARIGASTVNSTLYMNCIIPCKDCMVLLVNAGIKEVVVDNIESYHKMSIGIAEKGNIKIRKFEL